MGRLDELRKNIVDMDLEELRNLARGIRADRKITKERAVVKKEKRVTSDKAKTKASKTIKGLSPEMQALLLAELEGDENGPEGNSSSTGEDTEG